MLSFLLAAAGLMAEMPTALPVDPGQALERTCFQTGKPWSEVADLGSDVAIAYGLNSTLPQRMQTWRDHG